MTESKSPLAFVPGLLAAIAVMLGAMWLAGALGHLILSLQGIDPTGKPSPISAISLAILLGILIGNTVGTPASFDAGFQFSIKRMLRLGIILVGVKLALGDVLKLGAFGVPVVFLIIVTALVLTALFARWLGVSQNLGTLTAAATAICGVTAAVATAPVIEADDRETAYAVANVTLFGMLAMFIYPYLAHTLFPHASASAGMFLGTAIHDTSQVMAAGLTYKEVFRDDAAFKIATVTKLTRNVFIVGVVPLLGYLHARKAGHEGKKVSVKKLFPLFVLGFLAMAVVRSIGDATLAHGQAWGVWSAPEWKKLTDFVGEKLSYYALGTAMAAVGLGTRLKTIRALGLRPLYLGATVAVLVGGLGLLLAAIFGPYVTLG